MPWISQSSIIDSHALEFLQHLTDRPLLKVSSKDPSVSYTLLSEAALGAEVEFSLLYGVLRLKWVGRITQLGDSILTVQAQNCPYFNFFRSQHEFKEFGGRTLLREHVEFNCENEQLSKLLESAKMWHGFEYRNAKSLKKTEQMRSIGQQSA